MLGFVYLDAFNLIDCQMNFVDLHFLCFISNAVLDRPVDNSQNFDGVAYIA